MLAAAKVAGVERERIAAERAVERASVPTFRSVALERLAWKRDVKGAAPSTLVNDEAMLRDPGSCHRRGSGVAKGRIMGTFADQEIDAIDARAVSSFLRELDAEGMTPAHVNEHRSVLHAIFNYAMKHDTYGLAVNPVSGTDKRATPPPPALDFYEVEELEALARACERGEQRGRPPHYRGRPNVVSDEEAAARRAEDHQDAELFRVEFYSGMRLGEVLALRWRHIHFAADLSGAVLDVQRAISAGVEKDPKGRRGRQLPLPRPGAAALARLTVRDVLGHADLRTTNRYLHTKIDPAAILAVNVAFGAEGEGETVPMEPPD